MIQALLPAILPLIGKFIPDKDKANELAHDISTMATKLAHEEVMAQLEVNKAEAAHKSLFVAGWRPFIGWVCGAAMAFNYIVVPLLGPVIAAYTAVALEPLDLAVMMPVLLGMLGLGGMRSVEKVKKVAREK